MKIVLATVALLIALAVAACGGGSKNNGHSKDWNAGYKAGDGFNTGQLQNGTMSCGLALQSSPGGTNQDEFAAGCLDSVNRHGGTIDTGTPGN